MLESSKQILDRLVANKDEKELSEIRMFYKTIKHLQSFSNNATPDALIELFEDKRAGEHQWERLINKNRDVISWFNGMDFDNKEKLVINMAFGKGMYSKKIRSNIK